MVQQSTSSIAKCPLKPFYTFGAFPCGNIYKYQRRCLQHTFIMKDPFVEYYLPQRSRWSNNGIEPIYSVLPFVQRGHGIGSSLRGLFRIVRPVLRRGVKAVRRETLRAGDNILTVIADNTSPNVKHGEIVATRVGESIQNLIQKLRGRGRKLAAPKSGGKTNEAS